MKPEELREIMARMKWQQEDVATILEVGLRVVTYWLAGERNMMPAQRKLLRLLASGKLKPRDIECL
jgi:DNA-binding transcriptional regulator YiaG